MPAAAPVILLLKARIRGGAAADLFSAPVIVAGHVNPETGTYVAPHASHRLKRRPEAQTGGRPPAHPDLFARPFPPAPTPAKTMPEPQAAEPSSQQPTETEPLIRRRSHVARYREALRADAVLDHQARLTEAMPANTSARDDRTNEIHALRAANARRKNDVLDEAQADGHDSLAIGTEARRTLHERALTSGEMLRTDGELLAGRADELLAPLRAAIASGGAAVKDPAAAPQPSIHKPASWGMEGANAARRVRANRAAQAILKARGDTDITAEDRDALARYTGWGGCGTSPNEYFTPKDVAAAMWSLVEKLGFRGGDVLEPSAGTGVFHQTAPDGARMVGVELSPDSARINRLLHGARGDEVHQGTLESFATADRRKFDLVIGNPPFGDRGAFRYDDLSMGKAQLARAEHYFLDTALDKAKDDGLVAFVVPNGVMDNPSARGFRERLQRKGRLVAAFRLPNTAFADSQTSVTTDILVFRKRPQALASALAALNPVEERLLPHWDEEFVAGRVMTDGRGRQHVLGTVEDGWRAKLGLGNDITVSGSMDGVAAHVAQWQPAHDDMTDDTPPMEAILAAAGEGMRDKLERAAKREPYPRIPEGTVRVVDGATYVLRDSRWHLAEEPEAEIVADARAAGALLEPLVSGSAPDPALARARLQEALDAFVAKHGNPGQARALLDWTGAPALPGVAAGADPQAHAERVAREARRVSLLLGAVRADGSYSDAVTGAADLARPAAGLDAAAISLALRNGDFSPEDLAREAGGGMSESDALDALHAGRDRYAIDPDRGRWTTMERYLSGELWPKFDAADAASRDPDRPTAERDRFRAQAEALRGAIAPMDLGDVQNIELTSPFVAPECIAAWKNATSRRGVAWEVTEDRGTYTVREKAGYYARTDDLLERALMRRGVRKDEMAEVESLNTSFREWLLSDPEWRQSTEDTYNRTFRGFVPLRHSEEPIPVPGLSADFKVNPYQWAGVRWALERGKGIIAADVGVGKTPRGLIVSQLLRATGRAKRPVIVMPKSLLANWLATTRRMFPDARVLTIGETVSEGKDGKAVSREDDQATRRRKLASLAQEDHDFVLMTLPAWNMLNLDAERQERWEQESFSAQRREALEERAEAKRETKGQKKRDEQALARAEAKAKGQRFVNRGETNITLEASGIDAVILDEGHSMKNLEAPESGQFRDLKFLGAPNEASKQAAQTRHKFRWIREQNGGKNVFLLTATPTKNSPLELYSMLQHVAPEVWEEMGVRSADDFVSRFVESRVETVLNAVGQAEEASVVAGFRNLDEIRTAVRRYVDRTTAADVGLKLPRPETLQYQAEMDPAQREAYELLRPALKAALANRDAEGGDHPFSIMQEMQKVATDMRLAQPGGEHGPSPKMRALAENAARLSKEGGQVIFSDYVAAHGLLRDQLVAQGVDPKRIGIINAEAAGSSAARQRIADRFNAGELDVVIGNTATMGEGLNLQERTTDIHHADIPWEPASMVQRNGRGLRQGNKMEAVRLHSYVTKGSFDGYRWQSMMAKQDWQSAFWGGADSVENGMKRGSMGRIEMLIACAADPDEARAKFAAELEAAKGRAEDARVASANRLWGRYRDARRQLATMAEKRERRARWGEKTGPRSQAEERLAQRVAKMKDQLESEPAWPHKDLLDAEHGVLVDAQTGRVWKTGDEVEIQPGGRFRTHSPDPEPYIVSNVAERFGKVSLHHAGHAHLPAEQRPEHVVDLADLREGVTPSRIDREAARAKQAARDAAAREAAEAAAERQRTAAAEGRRRESAQRVEKMMRGDGYAGPGDLHVMGEEWLAQHGDAARTKLAEGAGAYRLHGSAHEHPVEGPDGAVRTVQSYAFDELESGDRYALPTEATRERLLRQAAAEAGEAALRDRFAHSSRRHERGSGGQYEGARREHGGLGEHAPALLALHALWPERREEHSREAARLADASAAARVRSAPTWEMALAHAGGGFHNLDSHGYSPLTAASLQPETGAALAEAARRHGLADKRWRAAHLPWSHDNTREALTARVVGRLLAHEQGDKTVAETVGSGNTNDNPGGGRVAA